MLIIPLASRNDNPQLTSSTTRLPSSHPQDLLTALCRLLRASGQPGRRVAISMRAVPLLVRLLSSAPSGATVQAAARALAEIGEADAETRSQVVLAGGLQALMDRLESAATAGGGGGSGGEGDEGQQQQKPGATAAVAQPEGSSSSSSGRPGSRPSSLATSASTATAAAVAAAAASSAADATALAWADAALTKAACFRLLSALAHGNSFVKNSARQAGVFDLFAGLMTKLQPAVEGEAAGDAASAATASQQQVALHRRTLSRGGSGPIGRPWRQTADLDGAGSDKSGSSTSLPSLNRLHLSTPAAPQAAHEPSPAAAVAVRKAELQLLAAAAQCCADLCQGNHTNQDTVGAEGLMERLAALLAALVGGGLAGAARSSQLLTALCDALGAAADLHAPNKLMARETGAADALARLLLLTSGAEPLQLRRPGLPAALAAGCGAVLALVADCPGNQQVFMRHGEGAFLPALFRLMAVGDADLATQAAK
jgi:hypothetical protein